MTKAEELARMVRRVEKLEAIEKRHIDTINRLLGHHLDGNGENPKIPLYEHELMHVNEQLAVKDLRLEHLEGVLRRIRQSARDREVMPGGTWATKVLEMIEEVMPSERPGHVATGHDTDDVAVMAPPEQFEYVVE